MDEKRYYVNDDDLDRVHICEVYIPPLGETMSFIEAKQELISLLGWWENHFRRAREKAEEMTEADVHD